MLGVLGAVELGVGGSNPTARLLAIQTFLPPLFFQRQLHDRNGCEEAPLQGRPVTRWPHVALQRAHSAHELFNGKNKTTLFARFYLRKDPLGAAC